MADNWVDQKKGRKHSGLIISVCILAIAAGFFVFNNFIPLEQDREKSAEIIKDTILQQKLAEDSSEWVKQKNNQKDTSKKAVEKEVPKTVGSENKQLKKSGKEPPPKKKPANNPLYSLDLPTVKCALADKNGPILQVTLKVFYKNKKLKNEILFKRDNIKIIIKKVLAKKTLSEVVAEPLRKELLKEINALLEKGTISDIEFIDFRPIENH